MPEVFLLTLHNATIAVYADGSMALDACDEMRGRVRKNRLLAESMGVTEASYAVSRHPVRTEDYGRCSACGYVHDGDCG